MENVSNNGYTRCRECSEVYSSTSKSCPKCGTPNTSMLKESSLNESFSEAVFNIND